MQAEFKKILESIGEDPDREGLKDTPKRAEEAIQFFTKGYQQSIEKIAEGALFDSDMDEMIIVKDIELYSLCEHHLVPFIGKCHVAYLPKGKILGFSKIAQIIDVFARRLQVQERLTQEIAETMMHITEASGVGVIIEAQHLCMMMRGVEKQNALITTSMMLGTFRKDHRTRLEFLSLVKK